MNLKRQYVWMIALGALAVSGRGALNEAVVAQAGPTLNDQNLSVRTVVAGLDQPTSMAFLGNDSFLVLEKATGIVKHVVNGTVAGTALDLAVNNGSERGLLGIALHPEFASTRWVYLYWTCTAPVPADPFTPSLTECADPPQTGEDTNNLLAVPLLGNRVDRFVWNGSTLTFDRNLIKLRAFQHDVTNIVAPATSAPFGNHNGGVIRFGPDGKLHIIYGDNGRRGQLQNLADGPSDPGTPDDQFGGPAPDNAHFTGVIIRLDDDGATPDDNPFFAAGAQVAGEAGANIQKIFAYGIRNSFGLAFDPKSGNLWDQQNGDDSFDELNLVEPGSNLGWIQFMGPASRIADFKTIETTIVAPFSLQQRRYPPTRIADSEAEARSRLFMLPGAHYKDPEFSWKFAIAPAAIGFLNGRALGPQYDGDLFVGAARTTLQEGYLLRFNLTGNRRRIGVEDPRLEDRVADNAAKFDITESESVQFGRGFGVSTDIQTGPNGNLFVVSLSNGAVYEIFRNP
jgi:glucose/arabinose dehydrogenase